MDNLIKVFYFFVISIILGCNFEKNTNPPNEQFVFVSKEYDITVCNKILGTCIDEKSHSYGSGVLIAHSKNKKNSYILTVAHVCEDPDNEETPFSSIKFNNSITILKNSDGIDQKGWIHALDRLNDLCLIGTEYIDEIPMKLAKKPPQKHKKYYNIGAPYGIWSVENSLLFEGHFSGYQNIPKRILDLPDNIVTFCKGEELDDICVTKEVKMQMFTIPAAPGSSGSPVFNSKGELVGIISMVVVPMYHVSLGATHESISKFLKTYIK